MLLAQAPTAKQHLPPPFPAVYHMLTVPHSAARAVLSAIHEAPKFEGVDTCYLANLKGKRIIWLLLSDQLAVDTLRLGAGGPS